MSNSEAKQGNLRKFHRFRRSGKHKAKFTAGNAQGGEVFGWWVRHSLFFTDLGLPLIGGGTRGFLPSDTPTSNAMDKRCTLQACNRVFAAVSCSLIDYVQPFVSFDMAMLALSLQPFTARYCRPYRLPVACVACHF